jgi:hypothetical protein
MDRREELLTSIETLLAAHREWQETDNPEISAALIERIEDAITVWSGGDMPGDLLDLYSKMQGLNEAWTEAVMQADDAEHVQTARAGSFWKALDVVLGMREKAEEEDTAEFRPLESVAMLTAQKVPDQQICWIYRARWPEGAKTGPGLWDQRKQRPLLNLLEKERQAPGSVIPADFVPFHVAERKQAQVLRREAADRAAAARQDRVAKLAKPCPETLAELVGQGVSLSQIARMKKSTKAAIRKQCLAEGLPVPSEEYEAARSDYDPEMSEAQRRIDQAERPMPAKARAAKAAPAAASEAKAEPGDEFGGDGDEFAAGGDIETAVDDPLSPEEVLVARWMDTGATAAGEIAKAIKAEGGPELRTGDVKAIMGRLKGDPERLASALEGEKV